MKGKSLVGLIIGGVVLIGLVIGIVIGVNSCSKSKTGDGVAQFSTVEYFDEIQVADNLAVVRAYAVGEDFTAITYQIDNNEEVQVNAVSGSVDGWTEYKDEYKGLRYIDTRVITIDLSAFEPGDHILKITVYNGDESEQIFKQTFELKAATAA